MYNSSFFVSFRVDQWIKEAKSSIKSGFSNKAVAIYEALIASKHTNEDVYKDLSTLLYFVFKIFCRFMICAILSSKLCA